MSKKGLCSSCWRFITLLKTLSLLISSLRDTFVGLKNKKTKDSIILERTDRDIPPSTLIIGIVLLVMIIAFAPVTRRH
jgi:uncharacterized oligopeptide transporter (OPT) family protein